MKKNFLFAVLVVLLAGFGFGGVSLADNEVAGCDISVSEPTASALYTRITVSCENNDGIKEKLGNNNYDITFTYIGDGKVKFNIVGKNGYNWTYEKEITKPTTGSIIYYSKYIPTKGSQNNTYYFKNPQNSDFQAGGYYKLYANSSISNNKSIAGATYLEINVTIDLNGYSLSAYAGKPLIDMIGSYTKTQNYEIIDTSENKGGKIIVTNTENAINVTRKNVNLTIGEGVVIEGGKFNFQSEGGSLTLQGKFTEDVTECTDEGYYSVYDGEQYYEVTNDIGALTSFYMSSNFFNTEFKVILNEAGTSIDLWKTKAYLNKTLTDEEKTASTLYQLLKTATTTDGIEILEVAGESLLFVNNTSGNRTDVFRSSTTGKFPTGKEFLPSQASIEGLSGLIYGDITKPTWVTNVMPDKYNEIKDGEIVIGYALHTADNGWFYAPKAYRVTFDVNGGVGTYETQIVPLTNGKATNPGDPTKEGYILLGWFNGEYKFDFESLVTSNITLTAKWEAITSTGGALIESGSENTGMVLEAEAPDEPTAQTSDVQSDNSTATLLGEIDLDVYSDANGDGSGDAKIDTKVNFTQTVPVRIPVSSGSTVKIKVKHNGVGQSFGIDGLAIASGDCTSGVAVDASNVYTGGLIPVTSGYVEIWTCSASKFVAYTEIANPSTSTTTTTSSGGGGGGGSSSYSCKNLPDNAVANNTTKPTKSTNYSYDTDTFKVCTFQCKTGYVRNEKSAKCEKGEDSVSTGDTAKLDETNNTEVSSDESTSDGQVLADGYTQEFYDAYEFAFKNGITTMPSIQEANMESPLTRIAMAKMLSQYAINVLGKTPDISKTISFPDVSAELDAQYNNGVTLAYQLGIMGINIEKFRPDDLVTRAEFGTALSRLLFGTADGEGAYYETHLAKLMEEKIITNNNPDLQELRGYVMIMLMRSVQ